MDQNALIALVDQLRAQGREASTVEFKSNWDLPRDMGEYLSALANSAVLERHDHAYLVWGVNDQTHEVTGTTFKPFAAKGEGTQPLIMWLTQATSPRPDFDFYEVQHPQGRVVVLDIKAPRTAPLAFSGVRYIRIDSHKTKLSEHPDKELRIWDLLGQKTDWSGEIVADATLADLDPYALDAARKRFTEYLLKAEPDTARHEAIRAEAQGWDVVTLLNKARITKAGRITRAALLLLGKDESAHFLSPVDAKLSWISRNAQNATGASHPYGMPFLLATDQIFRRVRNEAIEAMPDGTLFPVALQRYDSWVIREALHNCVAHQDYRLGGKVNVVEHPDKLVFTNLGQFIPPSVEWMLEHQSPPEHYRNLLVNSIANGSANAFLTLRVGLIAKSYCAPIAKPDRAAVRKSATLAALSLLSSITKEKGSQVVRGVWSGASSAVGRASGSVVDGAKRATSSTGALVIGAVSSMAEAAADASKAVGNVTGAAGDRAVEAGRSIANKAAAASDSVGTFSRDTARSVGGAVGSAGTKTVDAVSSTARAVAGSFMVTVNSVRQAS